MIGNNACGSHSVAWGKTVDNVHALDVLTYRGERLTARARAPATGRDPGRAARAGATARPTTSAAGFPDLTRRVSGYNLDQLLPGERVRPGQGAGRHRGHLRDGARRRPCGWSSRRRRGRWPCSASPTPTPPPTTCMAVRELGPADHRGHGRRADRRAARVATRPRRRRGRCPTAAAGSTSRPAAPTRAEAEAAAQAVVAAMTPYGPTSVGGQRPGADAGAVADPRGRRRHRHPRPGRRRGLAGLGGRRGAARAVRRLPARVRRAARRHGRRGAYYGHFGDGCLHVRIDFDLLTARRHRRTSGRSSRTPPTWPSRTAGRCPASTATARPAPSCCPGCTRREIIDGVRGVQGDLGPGRPDEPRPRRAPGAARRRPAGVRRHADAARRAGSWRSPTTAARSPGPPGAASASASA